MLCPASRALAGQGARLASAIEPRMTIVAAKRTTRKVKGSAFATAYLAAMKPLDQSKAKVSGAARMKKTVDCGGGIGRAQCPIRSEDSSTTARTPGKARLKELDRNFHAKSLQHHSRRLLALPRRRRLGDRKPHRAVRADGDVSVLHRVDLTRRPVLRLQ